MRPVASLPMYDPPRLHRETDALWRGLREALRDAGFAAPARLTRGVACWTAPGLALSQTCGLPFARFLSTRVTLIGAPAYAIDAPPGHYYSVIVVRADDPRERLEAFRGAVLALNGRGSQSGYAAIMATAAPLARGGVFFGGALETGAHLASMRAVAAGRADLAAIDAVTWALAPSEPALRVLMRTPPTPGLPMIARRGLPPRRLARAAAEGIASSGAAGRALRLTGFQPLDAADYLPLAAQWRAAEAIHRLP